MMIGKRKPDFKYADKRCPACGDCQLLPTWCQECARLQADQQRIDEQVREEMAGLGAATWCIGAVVLVVCTGVVLAIRSCS